MGSNCFFCFTPISVFYNLYLITRCVVGFHHLAPIDFPLFPSTPRSRPIPSPTVCASPAAPATSPATTGRRETRRARHWDLKPITSSWGVLPGKSWETPWWILQWKKCSLILTIKINQHIGCFLLAMRFLLLQKFGKGVFGKRFRMHICLFFAFLLLFLLRLFGSFWNYVCIRLFMFDYCFLVFEGSFMGLGWSVAAGWHIWLIKKDWSMALLPHKNKTWQWNIHHLKMYFILKIRIFEHHVRFEESTLCHMSYRVWTQQSCSSSYLPLHKGLVVDWSRRCESPAQVPLFCRKTDSFVTLESMQVECLNTQFLGVTVKSCFVIGWGFFLLFSVSCLHYFKKSVGGTIKNCNQEP